MAQTSSLGWPFPQRCMASSYSTRCTEASWAAMSRAGLKPFLTRGLAGRTAAWDRLSAGPGRFRRLERRYTAVWGIVLLADCVARVIGAFTLPVGTMVWLSTVMIVAAIGLAIVVSGAVAAAPMEAMLREAEAVRRPRSTFLDQRI